MTETEFLNRFQRQATGAWICTKPVQVEGPNGSLLISPGISFGPGMLFMGLELAKELDQMAAKHRLAAKLAAA